MAKLIHIPIRDRSKASSVLLNSLKKLALQSSAIPTDSCYMLPLTDLGAAYIAGYPLYMPDSSFEAIINRDTLHLSGLNTLPTTLYDECSIETPEFTKVRNSLNPEYGRVIQPKLPYPLRECDITVSVNENSDILPILELEILYCDVKVVTSIKHLDPKPQQPLLAEIQAAVRKLNIRGGIHNLQFLEYNGVWCISDWNPRPPTAILHGVTDCVPEIMENGISFMIGLPYKDKIPYAYGCKGFSNKPLDCSLRNKIKEIGLVPRVHGLDVTAPIGRVNGCARTQEELDYKFQQLEQLIA